MKLRCVAQLCRRPRTVFKPGILSVGAWGHGVLGIPPGEMKKLRGIAAACSGFWSSGACATSVLQVLSGFNDDPIFRLR
eukprot:8730920-Pyramimonas_sp.AAC.1